MQVVRDHHGLDPHQVLPRLDLTGELAVGLVVFQVTDVLGQKRVAVAHEAKRVLQFAANREKVWRA